jgi:hypothetical protein
LNDSLRNCCCVGSLGELSSNIAGFQQSEAFRDDFVSGLVPATPHLGGDFALQIGI